MDSAASPSELEARAEAFVRAATPLPGLAPYTNRRTLRVQGRFDGLGILEFLRARHPHIGGEQWRTALTEDRLHIDGRSADERSRVRGGNVLTHIVPNTTEPRVAVDVRFLYEDAHLLVLAKPAPLPVHPCGRYNRNTLTFLLARAFVESSLRPVHRLDADTTGVIVLAKDAATATALGRQLQTRAVEKRYLALVAGQLPEAHVTCSDPISGAAGRRAVDHHEGSAALTEVRRRWSAIDRTLVEARPRTGRTNQIRVHLAALGHPIVGDSMYGHGADDIAPMTGTARLHLHAWRIAFSHPSTAARVEFEAPPPGWAEPPDGNALL